MNYIFYPVTIPNYLISDLAEADLPRNWQFNPSPPGLRKIGNAWVGSAASAVLRVPSSLVPAEYNYLLNPKHREFRELKIGSAVGYRLDPRLGKRE